MWRFGWPSGVLFPLRVADELWNHLAHAELGLDHGRAVEHFSRYLRAEEAGAVLREVFGQKSETAVEPSSLG